MGSRSKAGSAKKASVSSRLRTAINVEDFAYRLTSRKFFLTLFVCVYFMWRGEPAFSSLTQVIIAFLAIQGGTDALAKLAEVRITRTASQPDYGLGSGELDENVMSAAQNAQYNSQIDNSYNMSGPVPPGD